MQHETDIYRTARREMPVEQARLSQGADSTFGTRMCIANLWPRLKMGLVLCVHLPGYATEAGVAKQWTDLSPKRG